MSDDNASPGPVKSEGLTPPDLSQAELTVLRPLWDDSPMTVRQIHEVVSPRTGWAYTTTKTVLDRLFAKGQLNRTPSGNSFAYEALVSRPEGLARVIRAFAHRVLGVDDQAIVAMAKGAGSITPQEAEDLQALIDGLDAPGRSAASAHSKTGGRND